MRKGGLGRGLDALISNTSDDTERRSNESAEEHSERIKKKVERLKEEEEKQNTSATATLQERPAARETEIDVEKIDENRDQPRRTFDEIGLIELSQSIMEKGVIQPIIVKSKGDRYELICGERRLRAAKMAKIEKIPAVIKEVAEDELLEMALIENLQREDLNPIEEAEAYERLINERTLTQEQVAKRVGKDRATVTNSLRILRLPEDVRELVLEGKITSGHARAIVSLPTEEYQRRLAKLIVDQGMSVRQAEEYVQKTGGKKRRAKRLRYLDAEILDLESRLQRYLGTQVRLFAGKQKGRLEIKYFSLDELDRILKTIGLPESSA